MQDRYQACDSDAPECPTHQGRAPTSEKDKRDLGARKRFGYLSRVKTRDPFVGVRRPPEVACPQKNKDHFSLGFLTD